MTRNRLLILLVSLILPAATQTAYSACVTINEACLDKAVSPPSLEPPLSSFRANEPDTSALAPVLSPDSATPITSERDSQQALHNIHDSELLAVPGRTRVLKDPFGQAMMQPLQITPQNP